MSNSDLDKLSWDEIEAAVEEDFELWIGPLEVQWIKLAWSTLAESGATSFSTQIERTQVVIRFLALVSIYRDFCWVAWQSRCEVDYYEWAEALESSPFRVGQLVGLGTNVDDESDYIALSEALEDLAHKAREWVLQALLRGFGGRVKLFISLWDSQVSDHISSPMQDPYENCHKGRDDSPTKGQYGSGNQVGDKLTAISWIMRNCPSNRTEYSA
jgi:hypothetical protein